MARYIAKNIVAAGLAEKCTVTLAYAIGKAEPVAVDVDTHLTGTYPDEVLEQAVRRLFDLTPAGMIRTLRLDQPIFAGACNYGHFTRESLPWEQTDRVAPLTKLCAALDRGGYRGLKYAASCPYIGIARDEQERPLRLDGTKVSLLDKYGYTEQDAKQLCREAGLLSPVYEFTDRGRLLVLPQCQNTGTAPPLRPPPGSVGQDTGTAGPSGKVSEKFNRTMTFADIDARFRQEDDQLNLFRHAA